MPIREDIESVTVAYKDGAEVTYEGDEVVVKEVATEVPHDGSNKVTPVRYLTILIHLTAKP